MRLDLHVHTYHSSDSLLAPDDIVQAARRRGLDGLAILDHDTIGGALELCERAPFLVIVGEEIKTAEGEIAGLFLRERIPPGLSPEETIAAIREQGGVVYVPHPLDRLRRSALGRRSLERVIDRVDALEVFNARDLIRQNGELARRLAVAHGLAMGAGSDAHVAYEIGRGYVEIEPFDSPSSFLAALRHGVATGALTTPLIHGLTTLTRFYRRLAGKPPAG
ncbi:MAG: PHP domain-containing protein [Anaerolineae bacterium]|nr:PHP domain-containing protein [Anaerolineae bacterium]